MKLNCHHNLINLVKPNRVNTKKTNLKIILIKIINLDKPINSNSFSNEFFGSSGIIHK